MSVRVLAPGEWAVLALICEHPTHGWAIAEQLSSKGDLGSIWSLGRPLVYRSLDILEERVLIEAAGHEPGLRGPNRTIFRVTDAGATAVAAWLTEPVEHIREGRSLLLLKLVFAARTQIDPLPMLLAQREAALGATASLQDRLRDSAGAEAILLRFRLESTFGLLRFLDAMIDGRSVVARAV